MKPIKITLRYTLIVLLLFNIINSFLAMNIISYKQGNSFKPVQHYPDNIYHKNTYIGTSMNHALNTYSQKILRIKNTNYLETRWPSNPTYYESKLMALKLSMGPVVATAIGDIDGDGYKELIGGYGFWIRADKYNYTSGSVSLMWEKSIECKVLDLRIVDVDGDNVVDILYLGEGAVGTLNGSGEKIWEIRRAFRAMDIDDINGDTKSEIIAGDRFGYIYLIYLNSTMNTLTKLDSEIKIIKVAELNGEKKIVCVTSTRIYVLKTNGDILAQRDVSNVIDLEVGDADNDGVNEILIGGLNYIMAADANLNIEWNEYCNNTHLAIEDINSDGQIELIISNGSNIILYGGYDNKVWTFGIGTTSQKITIGQIEVDSNLEIVVLAGDKIYVINDDGSLYFNQQLGGTLLTVYIENIDTDTANELFIGSDNSIAYVLDDTNTIIWKYSYSGYATGGMLVNDVDFDGMPEIIITHYNPNYIAYYDDNLEFRWKYSINSSFSYKIFANDINNDNIKEIIAICDGNLYAFDISGTLLFSNNFGIISSPYYESNCVDFADYDQDNFNEIFLACYGYVKIVNDTGNIEQQISLPNNDNASAIDIADIDNDNQIEIVVGCKSGYVYVLEINGTVTLSYKTGGYVRDLIVIDVDFDGQKEIIVGSNDGVLYVIRNTGSLYWSSNLGAGITDIEASNLDNDPEIEIIAGIEVWDCSLYVFEHVGTIKWSRYLPNPNHIDVSDINNDERMEILVFCSEGDLYLFSYTGGQIYYSYDYVFDYPSDISAYTGIAVGGGTYEPRAILYKYINASFSNLTYDVFLTQNGSLTLNWTIATNDWILYQELFINSSLSLVLNESLRSATLKLNAEAAYNVTLHIVTMYFDVWIQTWVIYDKTPPQVSMISPKENTVVSANVSLGMNFVDNVSGFGKMILLLNGTVVGSYVAGVNACVINNSLLYLYSKLVSYSVNISGYEYYSFWINSTKPALAIRIHFARIDLGPGAALYIYDESGKMILSFPYGSSVSDYLTDWISGSKIRIEIIDVNGTYWELQIDYYEISQAEPIKASIFHDGWWNISIVVFDRVGNSASDSVIVYADATPPALKILTPSPYNTSSTVAVEWKASDNSGISYYIVIFKSSTRVFLNTTVNTTSYSIDLRNLDLSDGTYELIVIAVDVVGNKARASISVVFDTHAPSLEILSPSSGLITNARWLIVRWNSSDALSGVHYAEIYVNETKIGNTVDNWFNISLLTEGCIIIKVKVFDWAGNSVIRSIEIIVDWTPPTSDVFIRPRYPITGKRIHVIAYVYDEWGISNVTLVVFNGTTFTMLMDYNASAGFYEAWIPPMKNGTEIVIRIIAYDNAGNAYEYTWTCIVTYDSDNDGISDYGETQLGTDSNDPDTDDDGIPDGWEVDYNLDPLNSSDANEDFDEDGLINYEEYQHGTNPRKSDTDDDGMPDGWEVQYNLNPCKNDANEDPDGDKLRNLDEYKYQTDPHNPDTDEDGLWDGDEISNACNPNDPDTDDDGMPDGWEVLYHLNPTSSDDANSDYDQDGLTNLEEYQHGTNPRKSDTDDDGMPDGWEVQYGFNPLDPADGREDADGDGLSNADEYKYGTNPYDPDTDDDGALDGMEITAGTDPLDRDSDKDLLPDGIDLLPTMPYVDYGIVITIISIILKIFSLIRASMLRSRLRKWLEMNLNNRFFKVEEIAKAAKVPVKYVLRAPIGVLSLDKKYIYSTGYLRNVLQGDLSAGGVDPKAKAKELKVPVDIITKILQELKAIKSEASGWYYAPDVWYSIPARLVKELKDGFMDVATLANRLRIHVVDLISKLPENVLITSDESVPIEQRLVYSKVAQEKLRKAFENLIEREKVLPVKKIAQELGILATDVHMFAPENAIKSIDGKKYYSKTYLEDLERRLTDILLKDLKASVTEIAREMNVPIDAVKTTVNFSNKLVLSRDMNIIYHEDYVFTKLQEISKTYADVPIETVAKMVNITANGLLKLVQRWISEEYVPIRISYDKSRLTFIGELRRFVELPEPKGLKFE